MDTMAERISFCIERLGVKRNEFARRLGLSSPFVSELCSGRKTPSDRTIADICREFGVSPEWLRFGTGEMFPVRSCDEEIAAFFGELSRDPDGSFRKALIAGLAKLSPEAWDAVSDWVADTFGVQAEKPPDEDAEK